MTTARRIATIALFSSALATSAIAADIQQPVSDWTGWHVGAGVGYGMVNHEIDIDAQGLGTLDFSGFGGEGGLATLEAGYDLNVGSNFVLGAQVDYTYSGISTDINGFIGGLGSADYELEATHAISAIIRGGHLINDNTLMYSLIGWTHTWWNGDLGVADNNGAPVFGASYDYDTDGLTLGGGIESAIANNTTLKLEYRYTMNEDANIFTIPAFFPVMFELTADDRAYADVFRQILDAGAQAADAANDQIDLDARVRRRVQRTHDDRIDQRVHLQPNLRRTPCPRMRGLFLDVLQHALARPRETDRAQAG